MKNKVRILKYVEDSFEGKPSFIILLDTIEYISNGCVFVENTKVNYVKLVDELGCKTYLDELLSCPVLENHDSVTNMSFMFFGCNSLTDVVLDTKNATNMKSMFDCCRSLTKVALDTKKVTNTSFMFYECRNLTNVVLDTKNVTNANYMFSGCSSLTKVELDISKVTGKRSMFDGCTNLIKEF